MIVFKEIDVIRTRVPIEADVVGEGRKVVISNGTLGTVVLVHGPPDDPVAYDVEFEAGDLGAIVLATFDPADIVAP